MRRMQEEYHKKDKKLYMCLLTWKKLLMVWAMIKNGSVRSNTGWGSKIYNEL